MIYLSFISVLPREYFLFPGNGLKSPQYKVFIWLGMWDSKS